MIEVVNGKISDLLFTINLVNHKILQFNKTHKEHYNLFCQYFMGKIIGGLMERALRVVIGN